MCPLIVKETLTARKLIEHLQITTRNRPTFLKYPKEHTGYCHWIFYIGHRFRHNPDVAKVVKQTTVIIFLMFITTTS